MYIVFGFWFFVKLFNSIIFFERDFILLINLFIFDILRYFVVNDNFFGFFGILMMKELSKDLRIGELILIVEIFVVLVIFVKKLIMNI